MLDNVLQEDVVEIKEKNGTVNYGVVQSVDDGVAWVVKSDNSIVVIPLERVKVVCRKFSSAKPPETKLEPVDIIDFNDEHYNKLSVQPMDIINKWPVEQQIGFYRGNILKYTMRLGKKDAGVSEASKILRYSMWLYQCLNGEDIDPRE